MKTTGRGFSLIELLIALLIVLAAGAMTFQLFRENERVIRDQNLIMEMQQTARVVISQIADEIRMAGQGVPIFATTFDGFLHLKQRRFFSRLDGNANRFPGRLIERRNGSDHTCTDRPLHRRASDIQRRRFDGFRCRQVRLHMGPFDERMGMDAGASALRHLDNCYVYTPADRRQWHGQSISPQLPRCPLRKPFPFF